MTLTLKKAAFALLILALFLATGCGTQASHPNQINPFDGSTFDSLLMAQGALNYLQPQIAASYPKYKPMFNEAATAYGVAMTTYQSFRTKPATQADVVAAAGNLTVAIVALENAFLADAHASPQAVAVARIRAKRWRMSATRAGITVSDILTELEIAAAVARTIPAASQYAALAQLVIGTTNAALVANSAQAGQPIDLTLLQPVVAFQ